MAQKNKVHIGLISVPKVEVAKDANKEARAKAINQKMKDRLEGKPENKLVTPIDELFDQQSRPETPNILVDDRVPSPSSTQSNPLYAERIRHLRNEKECSSIVDDILDKSQIKVNEKLKPTSIGKVYPLLSTHQMSLVKRQSIKPIEPELKIENQILKFQEDHDPSYHARIKINNIAEIKPPPRVINRKKVVEKVEKELHYIAMRDDSVLPKLIEKQQDHEEIKNEILDVWGEIEEELKYGRAIAEELLQPKNLDRLNKIFWAHLEEEKKNIKSKEGMPIVSEEYERIMAEARHTIEFNYNSLNISQKVDIKELVKIPRRDWTLAQREKYLNAESKARGVTWLNLDDHFDDMKKGMPSLLTKEDCTFTKIPNLYVRTIRQIYDDCIENKKQMWAFYNLWRLKNRIAEHRRAMKKQTTAMLVPWRKTLDQERLYDERMCMFETFGRAFFTNDNLNQRNKKFKKIKQSTAAQEDSDHNSDTEIHYDKYFDEQMNQFDQLTVGEEAILHYLDLYREVERYTEEYEFKGKEMKSPLMTFLSMLNKGIVNGRIQPQLPKTFGLTHRRKADEINVNSFQITNEYIDPLARAFELSLNLRKLDLRRCNLSKENCSKILQHLPENLEILNMSHNFEFGPENAKLICEEVLSDPRFILDSVILEECNLGNEGILFFGTLLASKNASLLHLDVSKNVISHKGSNKFFELFKENKRLKVLQMHYNPISYRGSKMLAEMLQKNQSLEILDISYCNLGHAKDGGPTWYELEYERIRKENEFEQMKLNPNKQNIPLTKEQIAAREAIRKKKEREAIAAANLRNRLPPRKKQLLEYDFEPAEEWEKAFSKNTTLVHLDISYNDFDSQEVEIIKRGFDQNKSIYGIHFQGNEGKIDNNLFINCHDHEAQKDVDDVGLQGIFTRIQPSLQAGVQKNLARIRLQATSNCWICEGWSPMKFQFMPDEWIDVDLVPIKLHLSCDNYQGELLAQDMELTKIAQAKEDERLKIEKEKLDEEAQKQFEAATESVHVEEHIDLDSLDIQELNDREREAVLNGDEEDIGKIVNMDKIMKQLADKLEKQRTVSESISQKLSKLNSTKSNIETFSNTVDSEMEEREDAMSSLDTSTKSKMEKDEAQKQEQEQADMDQIKVRLANKIKKIFTQEQKLVKIIEFPEKHTKKLTEEERIAKEKADLAAQNNFDLPQPPENPYETEHFKKKRVKEEAVQKIRDEKARKIREAEERKLKDADDLKEKEAQRVKDYIARLPPDPDGNPPVVDLPPLRRPPSGAPPKQVFSIVRMVPPGTQNYYFTINDVKQGLNPEVEQISTMKMVHGGTKLAMLSVPRTNIIRNIVQDRNEWDGPYRSDISCRPRPVPFIMAGRLKLKTPWDFRKSVFKAYKPDTKRVLDGCFEVDWEATKCPKLMKDDPAQIKQLRQFIKSNYKGMREVYKYYAGVQAARVASISSGTIVEILKHCDKQRGWVEGDPLNPFIDGKVIRATDVEIQIIAINGGKRGPPNWLSPDKSLVRFQFMEILVRLSIDKYFKTGVCESPADAVIFAFENHFIEYFVTYNSHNWRKENLWREEVDLVYTRFNKQLETVYKKYVGKFPTPGSAKLTMSSEEFISFLSDSDLLNEGFAQKQAGPLWNVSIQTNKDELENEKHLCMNYVEFQECLARVADYFVVDDPDNELCLEDHFPEFRAKHPKLLDKKLECTIIKILEKLLPERQYNFIFQHYSSLVEKDIEKERAGAQIVFN